MITVLCRALARQLPPSLCRVRNGVILRNPIFLPGAAVSTSCMNYRRVKHSPGSVGQDYGDNALVDVDEELDFYNLKESKLKQLEKTKNKEYHEYISDESDSDEELPGSDDQIQVTFRSLSPRSKLARQEISNCKLSALKESGLCLVKELYGVKRIMDKGIKPKKLFFTDARDLSKLKSNLDGIEMFHIHPRDAPLIMQGKRHPPFFAIFYENDLQSTLSTSPRADTIPISTICDNVNNARLIMGVILSSMTYGYRQMLFTDDFNKVFHESIGRKRFPACDVHGLSFSQSWSDISYQIKSDAPVFIASLNPKDEDFLLSSSELNECVNLEDVDFWTHEESVILFTTNLSREALNFCESRKTQIINFKFSEYCTDAATLTIGAVGFEAWRQWESKSKKKPKKVN